MEFFQTPQLIWQSRQFLLVNDNKHPNEVDPLRRLERYHWPFSNELSHVLSGTDMKITNKFEQ